MDTIFEFELTGRDNGLIFAHKPTKSNVRIKEKVGRVTLKNFRTIVEFDEENGLEGSQELTNIIEYILSRRFQ